MPVEVRPAPTPAARWRVTGSARHPLARYLAAMPHPIGGPEAELVVLGGSWTREAAVVLLSAVMARTPTILGWSGSGGIQPPAWEAMVPAAASARRIVLVHSGAGGGSLLRGVAIERPGLSLHVIEMREATPAALRAAVRLLGGAPYTGDDLTLHGDGSVTTVGWTPTTLPARTPRFDETPVLVTGGLGGLGARTAAMLAKLGRFRSSPTSVPRTRRRRTYAGTSQCYATWRLPRARYNST